MYPDEFAFPGLVHNIKTRGATRSESRMDNFDNFVYFSDTLRVNATVETLKKFHN